MKTRVAHLIPLRFARLSPFLAIVLIAGAAAGQCPGAGDCCEANGSIGCAHAQCCAWVCGADPLCCTVGWDQDCADLAAEMCAAICGADPCPGEGDCCAANGTPGCNHLECCLAVCSDDPFCCASEWDGICADEALALCAVCSASGECGEGACCFSESSSPGCSDETCCEAVCLVDPVCCEIAWDATCAELALRNCTAVCPGDTNDDGNVDVQDLTAVLLDWGLSGVLPTDVDPDCVVGVGDLTVVMLGWGECRSDTGCGSADAGDCMSANGTPYCADAVCCAAVCDVDPFCCDVEWDQICANQAATTCADGCTLDCTGLPENETCGGDANGGCNSSPAAYDLIDCGDVYCGTTWTEGGIRDTDWYFINVGAATTFTAHVVSQMPVVLFILSGVASPDAPTGSDCCFAHGEAGCDDPTCESAVCAADPFCCDVEWDQLCASAALDLCTALCKGVVPCIPEVVGQIGFSAGCGQGTATATVDPGNYAIFVAPGGPDGAPIFDGYPCGAANGNAYELSLECVQPEPGGCCLGMFCEDDILSVDCDSLGGVFLGEGVSCGEAECPACGGEGAGDCCDPAGNGTPFCEDESCCIAVCDADAFCCNAEWDGLCADQAADLCRELCSGPADCCVPNGTPGCSDVDCETTVCAVDPFCCDTMWDQMCAAQAGELCGDLCIATAAVRVTTAPPGGYVTSPTDGL